MAEKKKPQIVNVQGEDITAQHDKEKAEGTLQQGIRPPHQQAAPVGNAKGLRIGAVILWVAAIIFEVLTVLVVAGKIQLPFMSQMVQMIVFLVLDLACVVIGAQLWKKANHIDPVSEANPTKFWLWNNMGMIVCAIAFVPFIILLLTNKNADKNTKLVGTVVAVIAIAIGMLMGHDFNPVSLEDKQEAVAVFGDSNVYWTRFGKCYHTHDDCQSFSQTEQLTMGTVEQAIAANRTKLCSFCAKRDDITNVKTDDAAYNEENAADIQNAVDELGGADDSADEQNGTED